VDTRGPAVTDDAIESRLRVYRVAGPPATLRRRVLSAYDRTLTDIAIGWVVAGAVGACLYLSAWMSDRSMQQRIEAMLQQPEVAEQVQEATAILGEPAREIVALTLLAARENEPPRGDGRSAEDQDQW
jgi:hypothetical protein